MKELTDSLNEIQGGINEIVANTKNYGRNKFWEGFFLGVGICLTFYSVYNTGCNLNEKYLSRLPSQLEVGVSK